jgi:hypothetical protein
MQQTQTVQGPGPLPSPLHPLPPQKQESPPQSSSSLMYTHQTELGDSDDGNSCDDGDDGLLDDVHEVVRNGKRKRPISVS